MAKVVGPWSVEYPVNFVSNGDTTREGFGKHIQEIERIYGLLNGLGASKVEAEDINEALEGYISKTEFGTMATATDSTPGLMSPEDKIKLNGIETGANKYVHPTASGNKHIPSGGSAGQILQWKADGTAEWKDVDKGISYMDCIIPSIDDSDDDTTVLTFSLPASQTKAMTYGCIVFLQMFIRPTGIYNRETSSVDTISSNILFGASFIPKFGTLSVPATGAGGATTVSGTIEITNPNPGTGPKLSKYYGDARILVWRVA